MPKQVENTSLCSHFPLLQKVDFSFCFKRDFKKELQNKTKGYLFKKWQEGNTKQLWDCSKF